MSKKLNIKKKTMRTFLIFETSAVKYAIPVESVDGIYWLPEISPIQAAPPWFVGLVNWRGEIVHVLDLGIRFKHCPSVLSLTSNLILVNTPSMRCGIIVDEVMGLIDVEDAEIILRNMVMPVGFSISFSALIEGEIKKNNQIYLLLDLNNLLTVEIGEEIPLSIPQRFVNHDDASVKCLNKIFNSRMLELSSPFAEVHNENKKGFALILIGGVQYAVEAQYISEFTHLKQFAALPSCPEYLLGVINLRGEIISIIDMATLLEGNHTEVNNDIVILRYFSKCIGLVVQKVLGFQYFDQHLISAIQNIENQRVRCKSLLKVEQTVAGILDIEAIFSGDQLVIDHQV